MSKNFCKECFAEQKQIKSTTAAYSKLWMFGGKTCHVVMQTVKARKVENLRPINMKQSVYVYDNKINFA